MNLKQKMRNFFTLNRKSNGGFTLVELIVVIAILAILGGVAVPVYSGYIRRAERAGDETLLAAVNQAFAASCATNGQSHIGRRDASITLTDGVVTAVTPFEDDFMMFFDAANSKFEVFTALAYDAVNGVFMEGETVTFGNITLAVSKELADAMKDNTFSDLGAGVLTEKVGKVSNIAELLIGHVDDAGNNTLFYDLVHSPEYIQNLKDALDMDDEELIAFIVDADENERNDVLANGLVLSAAQKTEGMDTSFLGTPGSAATLRSELDNPETATDAMAKLALTYGMYTSYVQNNPGMVDQSDALLAQNTFTGMTGILETIEGGTPEGATMSFSEYMQSAQGQADLNAYMASMQVINDSANQSPSATKDILENGFTDPDLVAALSGLLGGN